MQSEAWNNRICIQRLTDWNERSCAHVFGEVTGSCSLSVTKVLRRRYDKRHQQQQPTSLSTTVLSLCKRTKLSLQSSSLIPSFREEQQGDAAYIYSITKQVWYSFRVSSHSRHFQLCQSIPVFQYCKLQFLCEYTNETYYCDSCARMDTLRMSRNLELFLDPPDLSRIQSPNLQETI